MLAHTCLHTHASTHVLAHTCLHTRACTHMLAHTCLHTHACTHTHRVLQVGTLSQQPVPAIHSSCYGDLSKHSHWQLTDVVQEGPVQTFGWEWNDMIRRLWPPRLFLCSLMCSVLLSSPFLVTNNNQTGPLPSVVIKRAVALYMTVVTCSLVPAQHEDIRKYII